MNILFRTAGGSADGKQLGLGHIYRCINLAKNLQGHKIHFLIEDYGKGESILRNNGFKKIDILSRDIKNSDDIKQTVSYVKEKNINIVIIDKYRTKKSFVNKIRKNVKTVIISDLKNIDYNVDLVVNGFIGFSNKIIKNKYGSKCLVGPNYQILSKDFQCSKKIRKKTQLLATFGGFDEQKIGEKLISTLVKNQFNIKTKLILGPSSSYQKKFLKQKSKLIKIIESTKNMQKEMNESYFGICSGGLTTYEFAVLDIPFAVVCQNRHQLITAKEWEKRKIGINLGLVSKKTPSKIEKFIKMIQNNKIKPHNTKFVDGLAVNRITKEILKL